MKTLSTYANSDVSVTNSPSTDLDFLSDNSIDRVCHEQFSGAFTNYTGGAQNWLEEIYRILKPGGKVITLHPNIHYLYMHYWDYLDHHVPLTDQSIAEGLEVVGFNVELSIAKFLPFTTKSKIPKLPMLVKLYLKFPLVWKVMGKQALVVARKPYS